MVQGSISAQKWVHIHPNTHKSRKCAHTHTQTLLRLRICDDVSHLVSFLADVVGGSLSVGKQSSLIHRPRHLAQHVRAGARWVAEPCKDKATAVVSMVLMACWNK